MKNNRDTPRTNSATQDWSDISLRGDAVSIEFSRQLEREINCLNLKLDELNSIYQDTLFVNSKMNRELLLLKAEHEKAKNILNTIRHILE